MSLVNLDALFRPTSIAVIGASKTQRTPGAIVMRNLLTGKFNGPVMPVTGQAEAISGVLTYKDVDALPITPDLAVICSEATTAPEQIRRLGQRGTRAALVVGPGYSGLDQEAHQALDERILEAAAVNNVRVLGPGGLGLIVPHSGLNASLAQTDALPGRTAFITQSDSLFTTVLDWAKSNAIGFSHFISLGGQLDITIASVLDYLGSDPMTRSILLYVESIRQARRFMSAARASARNKPILVMKPNEIMETLLPEQQCILSLAGEEDAVYDVAFRRAGIVRVDDTDDLFDGAQTLARSQPLRGDNLAVLTNGRSVGVMSVDACIKGSASAACFGEETRLAIEEIIGRPLAGANPVVLPFDADAEMYARVLRILIKSPDVSAVLVAHVPFADVPSTDIARAVAEVEAKTKRTILTCWLGSETARDARRIFSKSNVATFETPDKAIRAFIHMVTYRRNQEMLMETPDSLPTDFFPDTTRAREIINKALAEGREGLSENEASKVARAYGIPVVETRTCVSSMEAVIAADELGYPVVLKIRSPQIPQPYDVGGIAFDLETPEQVWDAATHIVNRVHKHVPEAYIHGWTVQQMGRRPGAHELYMGVHVDPVFGPIIRFGHGGVASKTIGDFAVGMPPLNLSLAQELIERTRISRLLTGPGTQNKADIDEISRTLIQITQLIIDIPQIAALEINPLFSDEQGVLALGARIWISKTDLDGPDRLAIRPYPKELEECVQLKDGSQVILRPIRPEDAPAHLEFIRRLDTEDLRLRFFGVVSEFEFSDMPKFTQIDYDREMAFIATTEQRGEPITLGVVRTSTRPDNSTAEFAIIVDSSMKGLGLGSLLMDKMIRYTRARNTVKLEGETLPENKGMIGLSRKFGFDVKIDYEDDLVIMSLPLQE
jgi:acetyltransferase